MPLSFSVVIPCRDNEAWLGFTLDSVAAQTLAPAEVIVVDDGSTDGSVALAEARGARVIRGRAIGASAARNDGVREAGGDWVAFLDADDLWRPEHLARTAELIAAHPADAGVLYHFDHVSPDTRNEVRPREPDPPAGVDGPTGGLEGADFLRWFARTRIFPGMSACSVRRADFLDSGGLDEAQTRRHDIEFFLRFVAAGRTWGYDPHASVLYRSGRPGNISSAVAEREWWHLRALEKNLDALRRLEPAAAGAVVRHAARRCLSAGVADGSPDERRRAIAAAAPHLTSARDRLLLAAAKFTPGLLGRLIRRRR